MKVLIPLATVLLAVLGGAGFGLAAGAKGAVSYLLAYALALAVTGFASMSVLIAARLSPAFSLMAAMMNYLLTVLVFVLVLKNVDHRRVDTVAAVCGLLAALVPYLLWQFHRARVRPLTEAERAAAHGTSRGRSTLS